MLKCPGGNYVFPHNMPNGWICGKCDKKYVVILTVPVVQTLSILFSFSLRVSMCTIIFYLGYFI
jgi:hypothetical protein